MSIETLAGAVRRLKKSTADDHREASGQVKFWMGLVGALAAGACQFIQLDEKYMPWVRAIGLGGAVLAFLGALWSHRADRHASEALQTADEAIEGATQLERSIETVRREMVEAFKILEDEHLRQRQLFALSNLLREGVERAVSRFPSANLDQDIHNLLKGGLRTLLASIRYDAGERWTITVYRETGGVLKGAAAFTVDREEDVVPPRDWPAGEGYAGAAFSRDREVVLDDAQAPHVLAILNVPPHRQKPGDASKYRSLAAVPIRVAGDEAPWGVIIATSDQLERFHPGESGTGAVSATAVRLVAGMLALLIAADLKLRA